MKLEKRVFPIEYPLDWRYGVEISQIRHDLDQLEKLGATHIDITYEQIYDSVSIEITAESHRLETAEEFTERKTQTAKQLEQQRQNDLKLFENIKAKYGL
jgi:hypothetical protein